eukprot:TRINITY_DN1891_c0_g1_i1.p1 TRINITY_DN1891_c0_g1~~TRINITY_DN1891_c0_g1_i1.p1  ORF type:complete len:716 (+),score=166.80 TRINITY_DN1891_c0_g1_i1:133-2148(+)
MGDDVENQTEGYREAGYNKYTVPTSEEAAARFCCGAECCCYVHEDLVHFWHGWRFELEGKWHTLELKNGRFLNAELFYDGKSVMFENGVIEFKKWMEHYPEGHDIEVLVKNRIFWHTVDCFINNRSPFTNEKKPNRSQQQDWAVALFVLLVLILFCSLLFPVAFFYIIFMVIVIFIALLCGFLIKPKRKFSDAKYPIADKLGAQDAEKYVEWGGEGEERERAQTRANDGDTAAEGNILDSLARRATRHDDDDNDEGPGRPKAMSRVPPNANTRIVEELVDENPPPNVKFRGYPILGNLPAFDQAQIAAHTNSLANMAAVANITGSQVLDVEDPKCQGEHYSSFQVTDGELQTSMKVSYKPRTCVFLIDAQVDEGGRPNERMTHFGPRFEAFLSVSMFGTRVNGGGFGLSEDNSVHLINSACSFPGGGDDLVIKFINTHQLDMIKATRHRLHDVPTQAIETPALPPIPPTGGSGDGVMRARAMLQECQRAFNLPRLLFDNGYMALLSIDKKMNVWIVYHHELDRILMIMPVRLAKLPADKIVKYRLFRMLMRGSFENFLLGASSGFYLDKKTDFVFMYWTLPTVTESSVHQLRLGLPWFVSLGMAWRDTLATFDLIERHTNDGLNEAGLKFQANFNTIGQHLITAGDEEIAEAPEVSQRMLELVADCRNLYE